MSHAYTPYPVFAAIDAQPTRLLTRKEEHDLAVRARDGDRRARGKLVERNLRLVIKIAATYTSRAPQLELQDLVNEGVLGLMRAIEKFDPDSGFKLSTYATWWITQAVSRAADRDGTVSIPAEIKREIRMVEHYLADQLGGEPNTDQVYDELTPPMRARIDRRDVAAARAGMSCVSLDYTAATTDGVTDPLGSLVSDPHCVDPCDLVADKLDLQQDIADATATLGTAERQLVTRRFGLDGSEPATLSILASELGINTADARRVERTAFAKMRSTTAASITPCKPATAILELLRNGRREPVYAREGYVTLGAATAPV